jgi:nucleotide-binding universal stress UspA family protein
MLHVLPGLPDEDTGSCSLLFSTITHELHELARKIGADACTHVDIKVARGNPASQILAEAETDQADLIVMGAADHSMFDNITHDRTICRVLAHAPCPVLSLHGATAQQMQCSDQAFAAH